MPRSESKSRTNTRLISVVLPVYNEAAVLERLTESLVTTLAKTGYAFEILFVNDGSSDETETILDHLVVENSWVRAVHFSRNFGHQAAVHAGLVHAQGDALVVMDSDFQDDPAAIPTFLDLWEAGYDVIYAVRTKRKENPLKRFLFSSFYQVVNRIAESPIPKDAGNFGLIDRKVADEILKLGETDRFFPGLRGWVGYRQLGIEVERLRRHDDQPRVSFGGLVRLAKTAIFSFSRMPLSLFYAIACLSLTVCCLVSGYSLYHKMITSEAIPGWTSSLVTASFFGAINSLGVAILGEYVVRIYDQVRARPQFIVSRTSNLSPREADYEDREQQTELESLSGLSS